MKNFRPVIYKPPFLLLLWGPTNVYIFSLLKSIPSCLVDDVMSYFTEKQEQQKWNSFSTSYHSVFPLTYISTLSLCLHSGTTDISVYLRPPPLLVHSITVSLNDIVPTIATSLPCSISSLLCYSCKHTKIPEYIHLKIPPFDVPSKSKHLLW